MVRLLWGFFFFFRTLYANTSAAFHLPLLCLVLLRKVVRVLMEQFEASEELEVTNI